MYINKLDNIVDEYNNVFHGTIKIKFINVKDNTYLDFSREFHEKDPKWKLVHHVRILKYTNIFAKRYTLNWFEEVLWLKKLKILSYGYMLFVILMTKKLLEHFTKKNCKKQIKKNLGYKKWLRKKVTNNMLNGKDVIINLMVGLNKK